jgi:hypothetical protein
MKIGYVPYSQDLQHPGDRRRINILADFENIEVRVENLLDIDVLVLSNSSNFSKYLKKHDCPIIIDLVDAYLAEKPRFLEDFGRNILRSLSRRSSLRFLRYTSHLKYACENADAVVVASIEQSKFIEDLNANVHIIIDDQSEMFLGEDNCDEINVDGKKFLFWEGLGYTLKHFKPISVELEKFLLTNNFYLKLLTNVKFHRWGGFLGTIHTVDLVKEIFPKAWMNIPKQRLKLPPEAEHLHAKPPRKPSKRRIRKQREQEGQCRPRLAAFTGLLMGHFRQSKRRASSFLSDLLNIDCSPA